MWSPGWQRSPDAYKAAIAAAEEELREVDRRLGDLIVEQEDLSRRRDELVSALKQLRIIAGEADHDHPTYVSSNVIKLRLSAGGEKLKKLKRILYIDANKKEKWSAQDLITKVADKGRSEEVKAVYNALGYLVKIGALQRVSDGWYRVPSGAAIQILDDEVEMMR
jgi:hypothetical protein